MSGKSIHRGTPHDVPPTVPRVMVGDQLRRLREAHGLSRGAVSTALRVSELELGRLELGRGQLLPQDIASLLSLYRVDDPTMRETYLSLARNAGSLNDWAGFREVVPSWFEMYLGLERLAVNIRSYQTKYIPGLFQTPDYAREVILTGHLMAKPDEVELHIELRMARQQALTGTEPPEVWVVIDEEALHRPMGNRRVMRTQIRKLLEVAQLPNITVQLMPFNVGGYGASAESFTIFRLPHREIRDVVYLEQMTSATYLDAADDVERYRLLMAGIGTDSGTTSESVRYLAELARAL